MAPRERNPYNVIKKVVRVNLTHFNIRSCSFLEASLTGGLILRYDSRLRLVPSLGPLGLPRPPLLRRLGVLGPVVHVHVQRDALSISGIRMPSRRSSAVEIIRNPVRPRMFKERGVPTVVTQVECVHESHVVLSLSPLRQVILCLCNPRKSSSSWTAEMSFSISDAVWR